MTVSTLVTGRAAPRTARAAFALVALATGLGGCAAERFNFAGNPFASRPKAAPVQVAPAPAAVGYGAVGQGTPVQAPAMQVLPPPPAPGQRVTDAPVGAGVNVQSGGKEDFIVNVGRRVFFTEGSATLTSIARETLDVQADWLKRHPSWDAKIQGFADDPGTDQSNMALGQQRADAVLTYLASKGVAARRLRAKTYGRTQDRLVNACADAGCKAQNRRVITNLEAARAR